MPRTATFYQGLSEREIRPCQLWSRPYIGDFTSDGMCEGAGCLQRSLCGMHETSPFALAFSKVRSGGHLLALADEEGHVHIFNTNRHLLPHPAASAEGDEVDCWQAHHNAIFDIMWLRDDKFVMTASGDQMVRLWDLEASRATAELQGHTASVKSIAIQEGQNDLVASGSRDGSIKLWDLRASSGNLGIKPCQGVANALADRSKVKGRKLKGQFQAVPRQSVTSILFLKSEPVVAAAGDANGKVTFWDIRMLQEPCAATPEPSKGTLARQCGVSSLALDSTGGRLIASCTDNSIYMYSPLHAYQGPTATFTGHEVSSYYVKAAFSPDDSHILSGSTDRKAYIWEVARPREAPYVLEGHEGEVTAVDWCPADFGKVATCADDGSVKCWSIHRSRFRPGGSQVTTPTTMRRRVFAAGPPQQETAPINPEIAVRKRQLRFTGMEAFTKRPASKASGPAPVPERKDLECDNSRC